MKKVLIWDTSICDLLNNRLFGGVAVQLFLWAQVFSDNKWNVYAQSYYRSYLRNGIHFMKKWRMKKLDFFIEWFYVLYILFKLHPNLIILRGAQRCMLPLSIGCKIFNIKIVFFGASDVNFIPNQELCGNRINQKCYQRGLKNIDYIVTQNGFQSQKLQENYQKKSLLLFNIWGSLESLTPQNFKHYNFDIVWVANFRRLKRAEWFIRLAKRCPNYSFGIAGDNIEKAYYEQCLNMMEGVSNLHFLGKVPIYASNSLIQNSRLLICSSEFEGFPNTFLQAWSKGVPVVSTVDPSALIERYNLGEVVVNEEELFSKVLELMENKEIYQQKVASIKRYFFDRHSAEIGYENLINYIGEML